MPSDAKIYADLEAAIKRRCPAMLMGKAMGAVPSVDEAFFLSSIMESEEKAAGLPPHWMLRHIFAVADEEAAKSAPYKCGKCDRRHPTSDKRNACCQGEK